MARLKKSIRTRLALGAFLFLLVAGGMLALPSSVFAGPDYNAIAGPNGTGVNGWQCTDVSAGKYCTNTSLNQGITCIFQFTGGGGTYGGGGGYSCDDPTSLQATQQAQQQAQTAQQQTANANAQSLGDATKVFGNIVLGTITGPIAIVMWVIFKIASLILGLAGIVFNWTVAVLIFQFSRYLGNSPGMLLGWTILRDFGNITLLFGFVFMGLSTILDIHSYPWTKALPRLVIFAVLLNFSLFAAEAVIDGTNVLAAQLYNSTYGNGNCSTASWLDCAVSTGIAGQFLNKLQISSVFNDSDIGSTLGGIYAQFNDPLGNILKFTALALVVSIAAVVLIAGAIMLLSRAVILAFLMVTSPIGFAGMAVPPLEHLAKDWWHKLINQALFAPVFILLLLVALKMTDGLNSLIGDGGLAAALSTTNSSTTGILLVFGLIIGFMIGALLIAKQFGIYGADFAINAASSVVYGTTARATNLAVGGAAYGLRRFQQRTGFGGKAGEVAVNRFLRPAELTNWDFRRAPGVAGVLGAAGIKEGAKPAEHAAYGDLSHIFKDAAEGKQSKELAAKYAAERKGISLEENAHQQDAGHGSLSDDDKKFLSGLSQKELEALHGIKEGSRALAENLTPEQFEKLMGSDQLTEVEKEKLATERFRRLGEIVADADAKATVASAPGATAAQKADADAAKAAAKTEVRKLAKSDLERIPNGTLTKETFLSVMSDKQRDDLSGSTKRTSAERDTVKNSSPTLKFENTFNNYVTTNPGAIPAHVASMNSSLGVDEIAKLDQKVLRDPRVAAVLTRAVLDKLQREGKLRPDVIADIRANNPTIRDGVTNGEPWAAYWS